MIGIEDTARTLSPILAFEAGLACLRMRFVCQMLEL